VKSNLLKSIGIVALVALGIWSALAYQNRSRLLQQQSALQRQLQEMDQLVADNEELSRRLAQAKSRPSLSEEEFHELLRLRGQVNALRQQSKELTAAREENGQAHAALEASLKGTNSVETQATEDFWPKNSWTFKGYNTADNALQTSLWAASNGDIKTLLASMSGELQQRMEKDMKELKPEEMSIRIMDEVMGMKSMRVFDRDFRDDDTIVYTVEIQGKNGSRNEDIMMKRTNKEWKIAGPAK